MSNTTIKKPGLTKREALLHLLNDKEYLSSLPPAERKKIYSYRSILKHKRKPLLNIDALLERHGYVCVQTSYWARADTIPPETITTPNNKTFTQLKLNIDHETNSNSSTPKLPQA